MAERKTTSRGTAKSTGSTGKTKSSSTAKSRSKKAAELEAQRIREEALRRSLRRRHISSVILLALGVVLTLLTIIPGSMGWKALFDVMHGLFGFAAYAVGPLMIYAAFAISAGKPNNTIAFTMFRISLFIVMLCAAVEILSVGEIRGENFGEVFVNLYKNGVEFSGGGVFAIILGVPLLLLGRLGATIIIIIAVLVCVLLIVNIPLPELFARIGGFARNVGVNVAERNERRREEAAIANEEYRRIQQEKQLQRQQEEQLRREQRQRAEFAERESERERKLADMRDVVNSVGKPSDETVRPQKTFEMPEPMAAPKKEPSLKLPEQEQTAELIEEQKQESRDYQQALKKYMEKRHPIMRDPEPPAPDKFEDNDADLVPIIDALDKLNAEKGPARVSKIVDAPKTDVTDSDKLAVETAESADDISDVDEAELPFDLDDIINENRQLQGDSGFVEPPAPKAEPRTEIAPLGSEPFKSDNRQVTLSEVYTLPPMNLLNPVKKPVQQSDIDVEIRRNADKLVETLKSFGVQTTYLGASRGPSVTRYELQPAPGVKISKISNLADDVALNLAVSGVRIAPVPDKPAVGIEIPNKVKDTVFFRELVDTTEFKKSFDKKLETVLGKDISGHSVTCNITKMPHLLIAGTTGSGKSVCVNSLIMSILMKSTPDDVRLIMVDPKQVEFMMYNGIPHLLIPVVTEPKKAAGALAWAVTEMERRYTLFSENNVRNIDGYNDVAKNDSELEHMPHIVIFIDELADLMMASPKDVEDSIVRLAQKARAAGMHLVIATQKPTVQVVTGLIKGNIPSRIALLVSSNIDSRVILDASGAEKLLGNGDMLYMPVGVQKPIRLQGCYVSDDEVERVAEFITQTFRAEYDEGIMAEIERQAEIVSSGDKNSAPEADDDGGDRDDKLDDAIEFVVTAGQASTSALQRHLKLGYGRAARIIDTMEKMGVVGPYEGSKPRQVLMTKQEWYERKLRS
ncbi:MAG: DNA translocase FtsK [Ruminococcaceae bacterium]|nr:DNA translocase FtsK [Oscillospiraceae bacterium]